MTKFAVISDIHSNLPALTNVLEDIKSRGVDFIVCAGDLIGYYTWPIECIDLIKSNCQDKCIRGNHDATILSNRFLKELKWYNNSAQKSLTWTKDILFLDKSKKQLKYLNSLKDFFKFEIEGKKILLAHGTPDDAKEYFYVKRRSKPKAHQRVKLNKWLQKFDLIILGHTHIPFTYRWSNKMVINPGSVGQPRDRDRRASYSVITITNEIRSRNFRVEYDLEKVVEEVYNNKMSEFLAKRLLDGL